MDNRCLYCGTVIPEGLHLCYVCEDDLSRQTISSDVLIIGYDCSRKDDVAALAVCRRQGRGRSILNVIIGEEATRLYLNLVTPNSPKCPAANSPCNKCSKKEACPPTCENGSEYMEKKPDPPTEKCYGCPYHYANNCPSTCKGIRNYMTGKIYEK